MSSDPHGAAAHDDDLDVSLSPETRRWLLLGVLVCAVFVIGVAVFVLVASENAGPVIERVQDTRDAALLLINSFA